jgi:glycosyltransferase involved in cell wall biosynthesis
VLIVARFAKQKDPLGMIRTLAAMRDAAPGLPWRATWIGDGPLGRETVAEAHRLGIADRVTFIGRTEDMSQFYQDAHVFILLSQYEGTPLSIIEAMRARLIIVATAVGGVEEMLGQESGVLVPPSTSLRDRVDVLLRILARPQAYTDMRQRAGARALRYDPSTMVARYAMLYRDLAKHAEQPKAQDSRARWSP